MKNKTPHHVYHAMASLPVNWFLHSRSFWLGLLVTTFFVWLTIDSHLNTSLIRTIQRGSWKDWSSYSRFPPGTPDETGSWMLGLSAGALSATWLDEIAPNCDYSGSDERGKADPRLRKVWLPKIESRKDSVMRVRGVYLPTWLLLAAWLGIWARLLAKSRNRHGSYPAPEASPAS